MVPLQEELSYEDVMNVYREEQKRAGLTEVRRDFYPSLRKLTESLTRSYEKETALDPYSVKTRTLRKQLENLRENAPRIFEYRAGKVVQMAVRAMAGGKVDMSRLTDEERVMFDGVLRRTSECRGSVLGQEVRKDVASPPPSAPVPAGPIPKPVVVEEKKAIAVQEEGPQGAVEAETPAAPKQEKIEEAVDRPRSKDVLLRILEDLPPFAGPEGVYRLRKEDVVSLPESIGRTLVKKGKAEEIHPGVV
jgi:DNA replication factor GINS